MFFLSFPELGIALTENLTKMTLNVHLDSKLGGVGDACAGRRQEDPHKSEASLGYVVRVS